MRRFVRSLRKMRRLAYCSGGVRVRGFTEHTVNPLAHHEMEHVAEFSVPIVAEVGLGPNWRDIK
jgi:hypothetical protein